MEYIGCGVQESNSSICWQVKWVIYHSQIAVASLLFRQEITHDLYVVLEILIGPFPLGADDFDCKVRRRFVFNQIESRASAANNT